MSLMRNFSLGEKFSLLAFGGALLFLVPFVFYVRQASDSLGHVQEELAGIEPVTQMLRVIRLTQVPALTERGSQEASQQYEKVTALLKAEVPDAEVLPKWEKLVAEWAALHGPTPDKGQAADKARSRHAALVAQELEILGLLTTYYRLNLDADPDTSQLLAGVLGYLPYLADSMSLARDHGATYLGAERSATDQSSALAFAQTAKAFQAHLTRTLAKPLAAGQPLSTALAAPAQAALEQTSKALALIDSAVLGGASSRYPAAEFHNAITRALEAQYALAEASLTHLQQALDQRLARQTAALVTALAALATLFVIMGCFGLAVGRSITRPIIEAVAVAERVAGGDLTVQVAGHGRGEMGQLMAALSKMTENLRTLVAEVSGGAQTVSDTSTQIADGNLDLSQRTEEQATTLEETASSLEQLTSTVNENAQHAQHASQLAAGASEVARRGGKVVGDVVTTMTGISQSSRRIGDIIGVIDGIAFQTNILALNAAVEAARAGEQGRGFAVVAAEVRSLAQRSAAAAKEIKDLISASVHQVESGARLVDDAGKTMSEIVGSVLQVTELIAKIAEASREQSTGIEQVNAAVTQMDMAVQKNASLVEEATAATESMKEQARSLLQMVSRFKLRAEQQGLSNVQQQVLALPR
jgi:methyl-accepting chemotaxis protein